MLDELFNVIRYCKMPGLSSALFTIQNLLYIKSSIMSEDNLELYAASTEIHDGEVDGKKVQIKISQQDNIVINHEPNYLIVLYLNRNGNIYEVYNGPGKLPWESASKKDSHNNKHMRVNKLMELDKAVDECKRITQINHIEKMDIKFKNRK